MNTKFLRFRHVAIRRYGDKKWNAVDGYIEFNPAYVVSCGLEDTGIFNDDDATAYIFELSNGTRFIAFILAGFEKYGFASEGILSGFGEDSNAQVSENTIQKVKEKIVNFNRIKTNYLR